VRIIIRTAEQFDAQGFTLFWRKHDDFYRLLGAIEELKLVHVR
jgi:hypothetical protein